MMNSRELMYAAMRRQPTERIPCMPQITHDVVVRMYADADGVDWIDGMRRCLEYPAAMYDYVIRLVRDIGCDGLRLFVKPEAIQVRREGDDLIVLDPETGARTGKIDLHGGGYVVLDEPEPPVETLAEAQRKIDEVCEHYSDEKMALLRTVRESVPDLFVVSSPGIGTMNHYTAIRGRERGMLDLYDRPEFVHQVIRLQTDAAIYTGEQLLKADIDCFMIGDPSASGSLLSPRHFREFCLPAYKAFCQHFRARRLIYIHECGNSNPILEDMAASGVHGVEPLDPLGGVSVADAKRRVGDKVFIMGGVNTLTLAMGTPDEVRAEAIQKCREGGPYGYVLAAGDMVPPNTSLPNLRAMVDVATQSLWRE